MTCEYKGCMRDGALQIFYDCNGDDMGEMIICEHHINQIFERGDEGEP